jgi:hypothetical protein
MVEGDDDDGALLGESWGDGEAALLWLFGGVAEHADVFGLACD